MNQTKKSLLKPACLLLYILVIPVFFIIGAALAGISGVAADQGLAGGAIVFFYGIITALGALIISLLIAYKSDYSSLIRLNKILGITCLLVIGLFVYFVSTK